MPMDALKASKTLSWLLRHGAVEEGLQTASDGGVRVKEVLAHRSLVGLTMRDLEALVRDSDKKRYQLYTDEAGEQRIRAVQGWTGQVGDVIDDTKAMQEICSKQEFDKLRSVCCHGTYLDAWKQIKVEGLKTISRKHIHFASHAPGHDEVISGMRTTCEVLIFLDMDKFFASGMRLFRSHNGVFLSSGQDGVISPEFFHRATQRRPVVGQLWPEAPTRIPGLGPVTSGTSSSTAANAAGGKRSSRPADDRGPKPQQQEQKRQTGPKKAAAPTTSTAQEQRRPSGSGNDAAAVAEAEKVPASALDSEERQRRIRKVKKSLEGVKRLEEKKARGESLLKEEAEKVAKREQFEQELQELEDATDIAEGWHEAPGKEAVASPAVTCAKRWAAGNNHKAKTPEIVYDSWEALCA